MTFTALVRAHIRSHHLRLPRVLHVAATFSAFALACVVSSYGDVVQQQVNGPPSPGPFYWAAPDIGWYWTPQTDFELTGIQTQLTSGFSNINNAFTFSTTLYSDRPDAGGISLGSFTWNGTAFVDGSWLGGSFSSPIDVSAGTTYFVGMAGWDQAINWDGSGNSGAGVNWVGPSIGGTIQNLGIGSSWGTTGGGSGVFNTQFSPSTLGTTDQPVIRFMTSAVPEPSSLMILMTLGGAHVVLRRRSRD